MLHEEKKNADGKEFDNHNICDFEKWTEERGFHYN